MLLAIKYFDDNRGEAMSKIVVEKNPYNGTWEVGWKSKDGVFTPEFCGDRTKKEAKAEIPGFDGRVKRNLETYMQEKDAEEREQNEQWSNLGYVRDQIKKIKDPFKSLDATWKLKALLDMDLHEHIEWPLPSWKAIESGCVYHRR
jgi:hypothetical protein